ncbi:sensor histidine kinase [Zhihengliuella flava]|uniref:histidine kinase n=1 Tax=Zhihengliuella flava TaxID=1285193 RepID=A0A931D7T2_9MICC|nr:sensor histidine kinase [Zhihengliuella flava]MBG6083578.1 signal transduction histidine kinase [Zhihengliuella flava]
MAWHRSADEWLRSHPAHVDAAVAGALWLVCAPLSLLFVAPWTDGTGLVLAFAISSLEILPLAWRRTRVTVSAGVIVLACLLHLALLPTYLPSVITVPLVVFTLAKYGRRWESAAGLALSLLGAVLSTIAFGAVQGSFSTTYLVFNALVIMLGMLVAWTWGDLSRTRRLALQTLQERAARLEREHAAERAAAAADERARIAREMHDVVAHSLSVMIAQADGGRYAAATSPDSARRALETIASTGRDSLAEMRRLLGVLRDDDATTYRPQPGLDDLDGLLDTIRSTGQAAELHVVGSAAGVLPQGAPLVAYRAVQEALTNVLKHAGPAADARVEVRYGHDGLSVNITDNGRGTSSRSEHPAGSGHGLEGMAERANLYDGTLTAGPLPRGGFAVRLFIPYSEEA